MTPQGLLDIAPERVLDPIHRGTLAARLGTAFGDGVLSLVLNAAVVAWFIQIGWPLRVTTTASNTISVEIIDHMPGETKASAGVGEPKSGTAEKRPEATDATQKPPTKPSAPQLASLSEKPRADAAQREPAAAPSQSSPTAVDPKPADEPVPAAAGPPPPEHPDNDARPRLVEAPRPPPQSAAQAEANTPSVQVPPSLDTAKPAPAGPAPEQPPLLSTAQSDDALPAPAPPTEKPPELTEEQKRQAETTAKLAAALPFSQTILTDPFQSRLSGQGTGSSDAYRGAVYGNFAKANDVVETARAQHLRGQAVVAFTLDDQGGLTELGVAVSSGHPEVDQAALELIRRSAPFPPPPPGAQRTFSPAIGFGLDE